MSPVLDAAATLVPVDGRQSEMALEIARGRATPAARRRLGERHRTGPAERAAGGHRRAFRQSCVRIVRSSPRSPTSAAIGSGRTTVLIATNCSLRCRRRCRSRSCRRMPASLSLTHSGPRSCVRRRCIAWPARHRRAMLLRFAVAAADRLHSLCDPGSGVPREL